MEQKFLPPPIAFGPASGKVAATKLMQPKLAKARMKGTIHLLPGQTGVMSYVDMEGGYTLMLVRPEIRPDGQLVLNQTRFKVSDEATHAFTTLMPDLNFEKYLAIDPEARMELEAITQETEGVTKTGGGDIPTAAGKRSGHSSKSISKEGHKTSSESVTIIVHPLGVGEGFDVELEVETETLPVKKASPKQAF